MKRPDQDPSGASEGARVSDQGERRAVRSGQSQVNEIVAGTVLGKYEIVDRLGSGGMGAVYEAVHTVIGKSVALKTMSAALAADPRAEERFLREAAAASRLRHPHVVDVTD